MERLGRYQAVMKGWVPPAGPLVDRAAALVSIQSRPRTSPPQPVITADQAIPISRSRIRAATYEVANFLHGDRAADRVTTPKTPDRPDLEQHTDLARADQQAAARRLDEATGPWYPRDPRGAKSIGAAAARPAAMEQRSRGAHPSERRF